MGPARKSVVQMRVIKPMPKDWPGRPTVAYPPIGTVGTLIEHGQCPLEKLAVEFNERDLGYQGSRELVLFLEPELLEEVRE